MDFFNFFFVSGVDFFVVVSTHIGNFYHAFVIYFCYFLNTFFIILYIYTNIFNFIPDSLSILNSENSL